MHTAATILITRPEPGATRLADRLVQRGLEVLLCPLIEVLPAEDPAAVRNALQRAMPVHIVIMVSRSAVDFGFPLLPDEMRSDALFAAPGPDTRRALEVLGVHSCLMPAQTFTSEGLLALPELVDSRHRRIVVCNAPGGRDLLVRVLRQRGALVTEIPVYRRRRIMPAPRISAAITNQPRWIVVITSTSALSALHVGLTRPAWQHLLGQRLLVSSERLARLAGQIGFSCIDLMDGADENSVLAALC